MTPTIGRVVHYVSYGTPGGEYASECRAAIITGLHHSDAPGAPDWKGDTQQPAEGQEQPPPYVDCIDICVLNPTGLFFNEGVKYDAAEKPKGGTWHWPERV